MKKLKKRSRLKRLTVGLLGLLFFMSSCDNEITDLFEAIRDYGYRLEDPLTSSSTKIDKELNGGYVYDGLPVIIEEKSSTVYSIKFLTTSLYKEDRVIDAHLSKLGKYTYMNLNMGDYFCVVKPVLSPDGFLRMSLVRSSLDSKVPENKLKSYLTNHGNDEKYEWTDAEGNQRDVSVYSTFSFQRVTPAKAYQLQEEELYSHKKQLYSECKSVERYNRLVELFPPDKTLEKIGHMAVLDNCLAYHDVEIFIEAFPGSPVMDVALQKLEEMKTAEMEREWYIQDSVAYFNAKDKNTIEAYELFLRNPKTDKFNGRAKGAIEELAKGITQEQIEWKWTNGEAESAVQYIFYKIDYAPANSLDASFLIDRMAFYSISHNKNALKEKVVDYLGKFANQSLGKDALLDLYMAKGFVLWSMSKTDLAVKTFKSKITESYSKDGMSFKKAVLAKYKYYTKEEGITFPEGKMTYKRVKKLK